MDKSVLDNLYNGNIQPYAKQFKRNSAFGKSAGITADSEEKLRDVLSPKHMNLITEILDAQGDMQTIISRESFIEGFTLGMKMAAEVFLGHTERDIEDIKE